jgi:integral membrane protein
MQGGVFMSEKQSAILGWIGTLLSVIMYVSYVPQIINNLHGMKGTPIQPLAAAVNCTIWVIYSLTKKNRDYPVAAANTPGIIFGLIAAITAVI